ncbi:MAG TPA: hypothetical protein VD908_18200 [Cytophagales bacterium]|nr:hypothetical protein [Cytophagales bacterium]
MKKLFTLLFSLICTLSFSQTASFSGIIHSKIQYFDSLGRDITKSEEGKRKLESHYYINKNGYKTINEKDELVQIYSTKDNVYHFNYENGWQQLPATFEFPKLIKIEHLPGEEEILGYTCGKLRLISSVGETIYWYSLDLKVDQDNYSQHLFGNWSEYLKATNGGIALKYEFTMNGAKTISTAYEIEKVEHDETAFDL